MKKVPLIIFLGLTAIAALYNSCKKDGDTSQVTSLLTSGTWQLASINVTNYVGDSQVSQDTLNLDCMDTQLFTFKNDNTCTYTNFQCNPDTTTGKWSLTKNRLFLISDMVCQDTTTGSGGSSKPFENAQIYNLGNYSLVLQTGDIQPNYSPTKKRRIMRYGFIRQRVATGN